VNAGIKKKLRKYDLERLRH